MTTLFTLTLALGAPPAARALNAGEDKAVKTIDEMIKKANVDKSKPNWKTTLPKPEAASFDPAHTYYARMETTKGTVRIKFLPDVAPMHVTSFVYLARLGFYDGIPFHRVITQFMAQGGCPLGNGTGGPGYEFAGEFSPTVKHDKPGLLSMANRGPGTDGSQFFLTFVPTPWLDGKHTIFGEVVEGKETLKALEAAGTPGGHPKEPLKIEKVTIEVE
jgi:cyclophilin family peptidyl-prolyl cis-trans isomerase